MILGIEAYNIRSGGGISHLVELLRAANPDAHGFKRVIVWSSQSTLDLLEQRSWLIKRNDPALESNHLRHSWWQLRNLSKLAKSEGCDLLFVPGGSFITSFNPVVTISQNLLPFEWRELVRFGLSATTVRLIFLRWLQSHSFRNAIGTIFLTQFARKSVLEVTGPLNGQSVIIPHGVNRRFVMSPRRPRSLKDCSLANPFRIIYVSIISLYKHQWHVAKAVAELRSEGFPVVLDLIGAAYPPALSKLKRALRGIDPDSRFIHYLGEIDYTEIHELYANADIAVFASSCETFGQILTESMSAGLPIACSRSSAMPEILGDSGIYFDPENPSEIACAIRQLMEDDYLRAQCAESAFIKSQAYTWDRCASQTFAFLASCHHYYRSKVNEIVIR